MFFYVELESSKSIVRRLENSITLHLKSYSLPKSKVQKVLVENIAIIAHRFISHDDKSLKLYI